MLLNSKYTPDTGEDKNKFTGRHIVDYQLTDIILKASKEKRQITSEGMTIRLTANFSQAAADDSEQWHNIFKILKVKHCQPRT